MVVSVIVTAHLSGVRIGPLFDAEGSKSALAILRAFASPDLSSEFLWRIAKLSVESLLIGLLATTLAVLLGAGMALLIIKVPTLRDSPERAPFWNAAGTLIRFVFRTILAVFRSVPDIVWAFLFVRMFGLGPGAAVMAIMISTGGVFGKLFAELAEAVEPESIRAMRRLGVGRFGILIHGVLPQVWRQWVGYAFYRLECSVRSASILGIVGAGGLGSEIALGVRYFEFEKLATALLAVLFFVIAIELASSFLRRKSFKWTIWLALGGSVVALVKLDIPWSEFTFANFIPKWLTEGGGAPTGELVWKGIKLALQTAAMAWCATWVAAMIALPLSPLTASALSMRGRKEALKGKIGLARAGTWLSSTLVRLFVQGCRAMPELTLALIFVIWVGPGPFAGVLAICIHTIGVLGRLYSDVYEEVDPGSVSALSNTGSSRFGIWLYSIFPQAAPRLLAFTLYRFEVNVRASAMVGFVGAGGIGDSIDTAISLFHGHDLVLLLAILFGLVVTLDFFGDRVRHRILTHRFQPMNRVAPPRGASAALPGEQRRRRARRHARAKGVLFRQRGGSTFEHGTIRSMSSVGVFIETQAPCPKDTVIELGIRPPPSAEGEVLVPDPSSIKLGRVVYTRADEVPGMAVELFDPITDVPPEPSEPSAT
ncbi:MAG: ABC transporter permease subunit [Deltaproteobacteria bacterium]|nr:ABC transporter permease subunit [Deltaproteobacteria bacterium]MDQ3297702.1 ABC transporter permease subunit [Myxococcota bacterium]